jgi:predicted membrane-bound spermidine synthase
VANLIYIIFFLSGVSALIFETVWFRLTGLVFGNSVWSAALILSGFMAGLAIGNYFAASYGDRVRRPVRFYAYLEFVIAGAGISLVLVLPFFEKFLAPFFRPYLDVLWLLNLFRLSIAFLMIIIPTTAMGATLPLLVNVLYQRAGNYGVVLGRLYGWNTLGAVFGALAGEMFLIKLLGIRGSGMTAGLLNLIVAYCALRIAHLSEFHIPVIHRGKKNQFQNEYISVRGKRYIFAAFLAGGALLALEVVWFRFLLLSHSGTSLVFAVMLAIVLAGIGLGGILASLWFRVSSHAHSYLHSLTLISGVLTVISYSGFYRIFTVVDGLTSQSLLVFAVYSSSLMFPVSVVSGVLFTLLGRALKEEMKSGTRAAGLVTLANTTGAMLGSLIAGFILLPYVGMEKSFFSLAALYGATALIIPFTGAERNSRRLALPYSIALVYLLVMVFFPFGRMSDAYFGIIDNKLKGAKRVAVREGLTETILYYRYDVMEKPFYYRLVTNGFSMSSTSIKAKRYMKSFVYLPVALNPDIRHVLLISYGVGSTAKALTDTESLETIDVVDISKNIMEMSSIVYPGPDENPLNDRRVTSYIEDGRFFLRTTGRRYDLITAEPPPPKHAGIVNLYSREYFELMYNRLSDGGIVSYWLPVHSLSDEDTKSIVKAFCDAFEDCSLWAGSGLDWVLIGTRDAAGPVSVERFSMQWNDPVVGRELKELGFEKPAQIGSLFIADSDDLKDLTAGSLPLTDDYPLRLSTRLKYGNVVTPLYWVMMDEERATQRFQRSKFIARMLPAEVRMRGISYFSVQRSIKNVLIPEYREQEYYEWEDLYRVLTRTSLRTLPLWMMGTSQKGVEIARKQAATGKYQKEAELLLIVSAISNRNYNDAVQRLKKYTADISREESAGIYAMYIFTLCMAGETNRAEDVSRDVMPILGNSEHIARYWKWLNATFGLKLDTSLIFTPSGSGK